MRGASLRTGLGALLKQADENAHLDFRLLLLSLRCRRPDWRALDPLRLRRTLESEQNQGAPFSLAPGGDPALQDRHEEKEHDKYGRARTEARGAVGDVALGTARCLHQAEGDSGEQDEDDYQKDDRRLHHPKSVRR